MFVKRDDPEQHGKLFAIGIGLMLVNVPLGWLGLLAASALAAATGTARWLLVGAVIYGISWVLLGVGFLLAGKAGIHRVREIRRRRKERRR